MHSFKQHFRSTNEEILLAEEAQVILEALMDTIRPYQDQARTLLRRQGLQDGHPNKPSPQETAAQAQQIVDALSQISKMPAVHNTADPAKGVMGAITTQMNQLLSQVSQIADAQPVAHMQPAAVEALLTNIANLLEG